MDLKDQITIAYHLLADNRKELFVAGEKVIEMRRGLESEKARAYLDGSITGKNETERKASERALFSGLYDAIEQVEASERYARWQFDQAVSEVEMVRALLRLEELTAKEIPY